MANQPSKIDPIRERYYRPLEIAESCSDCLFLLVAALSILALAVERTTYPILYDLVQGTFVVGVLALFFLGLGIRLYWTPRADDKRRQDLLSNSFAVALTHEQTSGYYNNDQTNPLRRLCASLLENSFFSKNVTLKMAHGERIRVVVYVDFHAKLTPLFHRKLTPPMAV
jgi:Co/Zn/Cd efflux system component